MKRIYHPISKWEEIEYGMWAEVDDRKRFLEAAIAFTGDHIKYGGYMMRVVNEWTFSCENALTDPALNKKAWVGHAACALAIGCPEDITRQAWGFLTDEQRLLANKAAARAIRQWLHTRGAHLVVYEDMGGPMLL
jgi:hypothetical protein